MSQNRPWLAHYPEGIPANVNVDGYQSLTQMLSEVFQKYSAQPAFSCMGKTLSFKEIDTLSTQFGAYLHHLGLEKGDRIALMMPNLLQYPIALFGALKAGLIVVATNPLYTPREMKHQFTDSGAKAIVICENFASNLQEIIGETDIKHVITTSIGELLGGVKGSVVNFMVRKVKRMVPAYSINNKIEFKTALKEGKKYSIPQMEFKPNDTILLQYTGGTTGVSKGAELTNRNLLANMLQLKAIMEPYLKGKSNDCLCPLPMYHIFALSCNCLTLMSLGGHNVLVTNARDLSSVIKEFKNYKITLMTGVNTLFNALLNHKDFGSVDFSSLRITVGGGMAVQDAVANKWKEVTGCFLCEGYGMTEASPVVSANPFDGSGIIGSVGMPIPSTDFRVVDEDGKVLPEGEVGEIQVHGPQVMKGYYNKPEETKKVLTSDGWLSTGDIGKMIDRGYYKIVDRKKDMILVSGFNVFPNEVEDVLVKHPKILEAAVIGKPDSKSGEVVKAFIVKGDKSLTEKEVSEYCKENFTGYKKPRYIEFRAELPKTNVGKILRRTLREEEIAKNQ